MIYLDNAATTQPAGAVLEEMMPYLTEEYANPGAIYSFGRKASAAVQTARIQTACMFGCQPEQVIFTSGGSEANSLVFRGVRDYLRSVGKMHILISETEHDSVLKSACSLEKDGFLVEFIPVTKAGTVSMPPLEDMIREDTGMVSVMYVNNETGSVNLIEDIGTICMKRGILFHTDCVQAAGAHKIDVTRIGCDFASISAHKFHGVKGVGALYAKDNSKLSPLIFGGADQEFGLRGGTENVPGIVAMGKACELCGENLHEDMITMSTLKQQFYMELLDGLKRYKLSHIMHINGMPVVTPGKTLNLRFDGIDGETLLLSLEANGVCASAGSACRSHEAEPSHVLTAMGLSKEQARSSVRVSFSRKNKTDEVIRAADIFVECVIALHNMSGGIHT